jgi:hypothetical protein
LSNNLLYGFKCPGSLPLRRARVRRPAAPSLMSPPRSARPAPRAPAEGEARRV